MPAKAKPMKKMFKTGPVPVVFSNLSSLDTKFDKVGNHNITISVTGEFKSVLKKIQTEFGKTRTMSGNKVHDVHGEQQTFKSTLHTDKTQFPEIWNMKREKIADTPDFGDVVDVRFIAKQTDVNKDKYISMYLDAIQVLENNSGDDCPFDVIETEDEEEQEDLPF
jgi:hypothetical protein